MGRDIRSCTVDTKLLADHLPIIGCIALPGHKNSNNHECTRTITKLDRDQLYGKINDPENWLEVLACDDPDQAFTKFTNSMQAFIADSSCTQVKKQGKKREFKKPWMTHKIFKLIQQRESYKKKVKDEPFNGKLSNKFTKFKNMTADAVKNAKTEYYKNEFEEAKSNTNEKWTFSNRILNRNKNMSVATSCLEVDGQKVSSPTEISESFNNFFSNIGSGLAEKLPATNTDPLSYFSRCTHNEHFDFLEVSSEITDEVIKNSTSKKAVGYDGISMAIIKDNRQTLSPVLTHMINTIIRTSKFPDSQKIARVRPLFKKGDKLDRINYRPISILTAISKITEKVLAIQLRFYLENSSILSDCQFGFQEKRNTTSAISRLME